MRTPPRDYSADLRLEVEATPTGLPNLVKNPSGEKGAWFWFTPQPNQVMTTVTSPVQALKFTTNSATATTAYWWSDYMPIAAGKYAQARMEVVSFSNATGRVFSYLLWYDANKVSLGSTLPATASTQAPGPSYSTVGLAPAGTAYMRVRYELDRFSAGVSTYPPAGDSVTFNKAGVAWANTQAELASVRTNLISNPSFQNTTVTTQGWSSSFGMAISRSTAQAAVGTASLRAVPSGGTGSVYSPLVTVSGGKDYATQLRVRPDSAVSMWLTVRFYSDTAGTTLVGTSQSPVTPLTAATWTTLSEVATAPGNAVRMDVTVNQGGVVAYYLDAAMVERATTVGAYFDGASTATGKSYAWTGTSDASTSTETASSWDYVEPVTWRNVLGQSHEIQVDRAMLDAGTLSAVIYDATLDPSTAAEVRPGRQVRLRCTHPNFTTVDGWDSLFEGKITAAQASYLRRIDQPTVERVRVDLTAVDNAATLANQAEPRGVAAVADLPFILEGKGVPWNVTGPGGNQVATATVVSNNDNASVLDQVAITRDTNLAQAFVSKTNVLTVRTTPNALTFGLTDDPAVWATGWLSYSDIEVDFSTNNLINEVVVTWLRYNATTLQTDEVTYGPYRDTASIAQWGVSSANYTIHGATESPATIAAYAQSILTANAQPVVRPRRAVVPVKIANDVYQVARRDLGTKMPVVRAGRLNGDYIVTGISHTITPELWQVAYSFEPPGAVASPSMTPSPVSEPVVVNSSTTAFTPAAGWSVSSQSFYRQGRMVHALLSVSRTGAAVTLTNPDHANQLLGTVDTAWRPVAIVSTATYDGFRACNVAANGNVQITGGMADASYTASTINTGNVVSFGVTYLLPEGV